MTTARLIRSMAVGGLVVAALGQPVPASAQGDRFARAIVDFRAAAQGLYGDEGPRLAALLEEIRVSLASWTSAARSAEAQLQQDLSGASDENAARLSRRLGVSYLQRHQFADALEAFNAAAALSPDSSLQLLRGLVLEQLDRHEEARSAFAQAFARDVSDPVAAYLLIATARQESNIDRALDTLGQLERDLLRNPARTGASFPNVAAFIGGVGASPIFVPHLYAEAFALHSRGEHEAGLARLREAAGRDPLLVDPAVHSEEFRAAGAALRQHNVAAALAALERLRARIPGSSETHRLLARVSSIKGDLAESIRHSERALRLRPDDERTWITLTRAQARRGDDAETLRTLERATRAIPESGELQWMLASVAHRMERTGEALAAYEAAARAEAISGRDDLLRSVAFLFNHHRDLPRAVAVTQERVRISRNDPIAHRELALLYTNSGRHPRALGELIVAAWLAPNDPRTFVALGRAHMALGRHEHAVEALQRAVVLDPKLAGSHYALAQALIRAGRRADSQQHLAEFHRLSAITLAAEREVRKFQTAQRQARLHAEEGQHELAAKEYAALVVLDPSPQSNLELARVLEQAGRFEESLGQLTAASAAGATPEVHLQIADVLSKLGRPRESDAARTRYQNLRLIDLERRGALRRPIRSDLR